MKEAGHFGLPLLHLPSASYESLTGWYRCKPKLVSVRHELTRHAVIYASASRASVPNTVITFALKAGINC